MPKPHTGALSGVTYEIPVYADDADIEKAFGGFADTLPPTPPKINVAHLTTGGAADMNTLHVVDAAAGVTLTLGAGVNDGDLVKVLQSGTGLVTLSPTGGVLVQGPLVTSGQFSALTAVWVAPDSKWVVVPFSFSGTRPSESNGGTIVDLNGRRYHVFDNAGQHSFYSHTDMNVDVWLIGAGGNGAPVGTKPGQGGSPGAIGTGTAQVESMMSFPVVVGESGLAGASTFGTVTGANGANAVVDTDNADVAPVAVTGDLATVLGYATVGGSGLDGGGPVLPSTYGVGGSGEAILKPEMTRPSSTVTNPGTPGTPGGSSEECVGATPITTQQEHRGDFRPVFCPDGWRVSLVDHSFVQCQNIANPSQVAMNGWMGGCPGGWYPCGMNCCTMIDVQTGWSCPGGYDNRNNGQCCRTVSWPGTPGTPGSTETVWGACPAGYTVKGSDPTKCVDVMPPGVGDGGDGVVVISYLWPVTP